MEQYLILAGCLLLGQVLHLTVMADTTYEEFVAQEKKFSFKKDFLLRNIFKIIMAFLSGIVALTLYSEWINVYEGLSILQKTAFITIGYSGSSLVLRFLNRNIKRGEDTIDNMGTGDTESNLEPQKDDPMSQEYVYVLPYENPDVMLKITGASSGFETPADFAANTSGTIDTGKLEIVWATAPSFATVDILWPNSTVSVAGPIRRPK